MIRIAAENNKKDLGLYLYLCYNKNRIIKEVLTHR